MRISVLADLSPKTSQIRSLSSQVMLRHGEIHAQAESLHPLAMRDLWSVQNLARCEHMPGHVLSGNLPVSTASDSAMRSLRSLFRPATLILACASSGSSQTAFFLPEGPAWPELDFRTAASSSSGSALSEGPGRPVRSSKTKLPRSSGSKASSSASLPAYKRTSEDQEAA